MSLHAIVQRLARRAAYVERFLIKTLDPCITMQRTEWLPRLNLTKSTTLRRERTSTIYENQNKTNESHKSINESRTNIKEHHKNTNEHLVKKQ